MIKSKDKFLFFFAIFALIPFLIPNKTNSFEINVFDKQKINFINGKELNNDNLIITDNGRLVFKKISFPDLKKTSKIKVKAQLVSDGDPWDKSGSIFLLKSHPNSDQTNPIELLRFITPFGVGHFSEIDRLDDYKPVYIPKWEKNISWEEDISHLASLFDNHEIWIGVWIDSYHKDGFLMDVDLSINESDTLFDFIKKKNVTFINNTHKYSQKINGNHDFSQNQLINEFHIDKNIDNAKLYFITTGHGAHSEGDEFNQRNNIISLNDKELLIYPAWREDCAAFRRFNPSSGVWFVDTTWKGEKIKERIASSDYSRSNWCPGSKVSPVVIDLPTLKKGKNTIIIDIPNAQPTTEDFWNHWNISSYLVYDN